MPYLWPLKMEDYEKSEIYKEYLCESPRPWWLKVYRWIDNNLIHFCPICKKLDWLFFRYVGNHDKCWNIWMKGKK